MGEKYTKADFEAYRKEQDEKAAKEEEVRRERTEKLSAKRAWLADGGSEASFEKAYPELRNEARKKRVMDAEKVARETQRSSGVSAI